MNLMVCKLDFLSLLIFREAGMKSQPLQKHSVSMITKTED
jgi:hypothetical protein